MNTVKLTEFSHGAGCGCKIAPAVLKEIIKSSELTESRNLLVGNQESDDAAVYDLGNGIAVISTTDFFMPIVDDPHDFGGIAAANALSDVYAMGGTPLMAVAVLGWPINQLSPDLASQVMDGGSLICKKAGIPLAGGHSIDAKEPFFGLSVTGTVPVKNLKRNNGAKPGDLIYLTKPLGIGIVTSAQKKKLVRHEDLQQTVSLMLTLNDLGIKCGQLPFINAMTDVTGFGLLGHLLEVCQASDVSAVINYGDVPVISNLDHYIEQNCIPGGTGRNWDSYHTDVDCNNEEAINILADPQTSGGLLIIVDRLFQKEFENLPEVASARLKPIGEITDSGRYRVRVL